MSRWLGQIAVITGASSGIGASVAERLVDSGLKVVGIARRNDRLDEMSKKFGKSKGKFYPFKADVTKDHEISDAFSWIKNNLGPVSVLVNNAGISRKTPIVDGNVDDWKEILNTNFLAAALASREALSSMKENNIDGHIVYVNSLAGHVIPPHPETNVYPSSKHALKAFTENLRMELVRIGSRIKVSSISPGYVNTEIFVANKIVTPDKMEKLVQRLPMLKSSDVADAILYILETPPSVQITELIIRSVGEAI